MSEGAGPRAADPRPDRCAIADNDVTLFGQGLHNRLHALLGCHLDDRGARFAVYAPHASAVSLTGDFNGWSSDAHPLAPRDDDSGLWTGYVRGVTHGALYKYRIVHRDGTVGDKADPFALASEPPPGSASRAWRCAYAWADAAWIAQRRGQRAAGAPERPFSIYQVQLDSWRRPLDGGPPNTRDLAPQLSAYVVENGFSHVEILPPDEQPASGGAGYSGNRYFAPVARYGSPEDFMFLVDTLHRAGIGVILAWFPARFAADDHGLREFDGEPLYEAEPFAGHSFAPGARSFDFARPEVCSFLVSSALFWLAHYHIDGLRVGALASMLYLDYGRGPGQWLPNRDGGKENLEAIAFLRRLNETVASQYPHAFTIAEEASAWPMVSRPVHLGGLGFAMAWNGDWTRTTLAYFRHDPLYRKFHHDDLRAGLANAFAENFILPLAEDEMTSARGALLEQLPGDEWQRFAGLRCLYGYLWAYPGKKLLYMGGEFGQRGDYGELDWTALDAPEPGGLRRWVGDLNRFYRAEPALHALDFDASGFCLVDANDCESSVLSFVRRAPASRPVLVVCNFTPVLRTNYVVGAPRNGVWREALNSDAQLYGGSGAGNFGAVEAMPVPAQGQPASLALTLPPHGILFFVAEDDDDHGTL